MKKKKYIIVFGIIILLITIIIIALITIKTENNGSGNNNETNYNVKITGKLKEYVNQLTNNYYIKYSGKFNNTEGKKVNAVVEYTRDGDNFAIRSIELDTYVVSKKDDLYSISHNYKLIMKMNKHNFNTNEYNLASDIGQIFVKTYTESVNNTNYYVEEYMYNGKVLKYYFKDNDVKLIKYDGEDIMIIRLEKKTNMELLTIPQGYKQVEA